MRRYATRDEVVARPLAGTEGGSGPFFSPDGASIGFVANGQLRRVPSTGGASLKLADSIKTIRAVISNYKNVNLMLPA